MDQSCSESDVSLSPSQILERLQVLRQLQLLQRGKLQKQRLQFNENTENSSSITEIVSHFSSSTSYNTFRSLLQSPQNISHDSTPRPDTRDVSHIKERDLIEGVSVLNLSQESELIVNSPTSTKSRVSPSSRTERNETAIDYIKSPINHEINLLQKKQICLDEMPILSPKKDFEALIFEKLKNDKNVPKEKSTKNIIELIPKNKKPFLRRGEGMSRFGLRKNDLIIQNTKSLPWRKKNNQTKVITSDKLLKKSKSSNNYNEKNELEIFVTEPKSPLVMTSQATLKSKLTNLKDESKPLMDKQEENNNMQTSESTDPNISNIHSENKPAQKIIKFPKGKHPLDSNKGKTWAAVLTKEQNDFLRQLKQSDYYKNFASPAKSTVSDISCDENLSKLRQDREKAEQNMFELLENKVSHESFNLENSFFNRFFTKDNLECSGESTPLIMQKCLANNPVLMHIFSDLNCTERNDNSHSDSETCQSQYMECCSDACSSISSCCSCKTVEAANNTNLNFIESNKEKNSKAIKQKRKINKVSMKEVQKPLDNEKFKDDSVKENEVMKANMAEMNAKLITTSELLKDRLRELEDEIETFRKENISLTKLREEVDREKQKLYEEKTAFEHKFNEEKILSEYYLSEEKEKLTKQKQMYERYVREMRGRLSKKDKDEVTNLKQEVNSLKEEIRTKDAKSTSTIARLRNHIKIMEKEKKDLQDEVERLKKENRRIQHSNDITRRLTNMKYLEEINKKLSHMSKGTLSEVHLDSDLKYKTFEIERQSRSKKIQPVVKNFTRPRAKSVPNLNITSRYAKYFSQRDAISEIERNKTLHIERADNYGSNNDKLEDNHENFNSDDDAPSIYDKNRSDTEEENNLEKIYMETFRSNSPKSNRSSLSNSEFGHGLEENDNNNDFFIRKSSSNANASNSKSPIQRSPHLHNASRKNRSRSPISILSNRSSSQRSSINKLNSANYVANISGGSNISHRSKSPLSTLSNHSSQSKRSATVIPRDMYRDKLSVISPEPSSSKTSLTKTNLNPTEIRKSDGTRELRFPNGNIKYISADGKYSKFVYYNGDIKENFYNEGRIKYFYSETKTYHTTHPDGLEVLEFPDGQVEKRYKDGSSEIRLPNGSIRYFDPKNEYVREEWRFPDGAALTVSADGEQRIVFGNGQVEVHAKDHKRREFPDGTVKLVYNDGTAETRYASGRVRIKDKHGNVIMDSASR